MRDFEKTGLPVGWVNARLGDIAEKITKGATPTTYGYSFQKKGINFIKIQNVSNGSIDLASITDFISEDANQNQKKSILKRDDVLFSIAGTIGETAIIKSIHLPANTNQAFAIISGFIDCLLPKFLGFQLRSFVAQKTKEKARGGAMNNVSLEDLKELEINLPPLAEQHRIVEKIEEFFSELDKGIESLKTAREQLKVYRQALLKHAFEGKLTEKWREENQGIIRAGFDPAPTKQRKDLAHLAAEELTELPALPQGWEWVKLKWISDVSGGLTKNQKRNSLPNKLPFLRVANVYFNRLDLDELHEIGLSDSEIDRVLLQKGDLLIVEGNGSVEQIGRVAVWNGIVSNCVHQNHLIKARPNTSTNTKFLLYFLMSELGRKFIVRAASSTSGLHTLSISKVEGLFIPLCHIEEQSQIINELEDKLSAIDNLDKTITTALQQSETLRQAILKKAFSGKLVPQDTHDEPATVLLERIKAERAAMMEARRVMSMRKSSPRKPRTKATP